MDRAWDDLRCFINDYPFSYELLNAQEKRMLKRICKAITTPNPKTLKHYVAGDD